MKYGFYEFFAGGGMARLGLGDQWQALFVNDFDPQKATAYTANFRPGNELQVKDVAKISASDLPKGGVMAWASFPCQDLSLAGNGGGLAASRSGSYWPFWRIMKGMAAQGTPVPILAIENVAGLLTSKGGKDFAELLRSLREIGYSYGAMVVDAVHFVPQSRPRLFIVAARPEVVAASGLIGAAPSPPWHPDRLVRAVHNLEGPIRDGWVWWSLPRPQPSKVRLESLIFDEPPSVEWHDPEQTNRLLSLMAPSHRRNVEAMSRLGRKVVGTIYKRTRPDSTGLKVQRAEVRFDGVAGCLRTPAGGSSRQTIIMVNGKKTATRLLDPREAARLMGVPEWYELPKKYNDAYHLMGDGLAVPAVSWVERHLLRPLAEAASGLRPSNTKGDAQLWLTMKEAKGSYRVRSPTRRGKSSSAMPTTSKRRRTALATTDSPSKSSRIRASSGRR